MTWQNKKVKSISLSVNYRLKVCFFISENRRLIHIRMQSGVWGEGRTHAAREKEKRKRRKHTYRDL